MGRDDRVIEPMWF